MTNKKIIISIMMLSMIFITACGKKKEEPTLMLKYNDQQLKVIHYGDRYNETKEDIEKRLKDSMIGKKFEELPVISTGEEIIIENTNFNVEQYEVYDFIIDENANIVSDFKTASSTVNVSESNTATFELVNSFEPTAFESYKVNDQNIHCLLIKCKIDKSDFVFATLLLLKE